LLGDLATDLVDVGTEAAVEVDLAGERGLQQAGELRRMREYLSGVGLELADGRLGVL